MIIEKDSILRCTVGRKELQRHYIFKQGGADVEGKRQFTEGCRIVSCSHAGGCRLPSSRRSVTSYRKNRGCGQPLIQWNNPIMTSPGSHESGLSRF